MPSRGQPFGLPTSPQPRRRSRLRQRRVRPPPPGLLTTEYVPASLRSDRVRFRPDYVSAFARNRWPFSSECAPKEEIAVADVGVVTRQPHLPIAAVASRRAEAASAATVILAQAGDDPGRRRTNAVTPISAGPTAGVMPEPGTASSDPQ